MPVATIPRALVTAGLIAAVLSGIASAASLPLTTGKLGAGMATLSTCDSNGFSFAAVIDTSGRITSVTVSGIAGACAGAVVRVTLANGATSAASGTTVLPTSGFTGIASVAMSPTPLSTAVDRILAVAEGA